MWDDFSAAIRSPLDNVQGITIDAGADEPSAVVWCQPLYALPQAPEPPDTALIIPSTGILQSPNQQETRLSLLHECIHMRFAFGEHRERWQRMKERRNDFQQQADDAAVVDIDRGNFMLRRNQNAFVLLSLPDEIVAEQFLASAYPELITARAEYYVRMRQGHEAAVANPRADVEFKPFSVYYELLRNALFIPLVAGLANSLQELTRLEAFATGHLRTYEPADLVQFLVALKPRLLDVSFDRPLAAAEAAYDELFNRVVETERRAP